MSERLALRRVAAGALYSVNAAIVVLQPAAKGDLSAAQVAEVNRWFAIGINPQINQLLASSANPTEKK